MDTTAYSEYGGQIPAVVTDMPASDYHAAEAISASGLKKVERSPAHYRYAPPKPSSRAQEIGTAIHTAILEPERFDEEYIALSVDDRRKSEHKEAVKVHGSERVLTATEASNVRTVRESVWSDPKIARHLKTTGWREMSVFAQDPETGEAVKCRTDLYTEGRIIFDLKKTRDARDRAMNRAIADYGYDLSAAFYCDVIQWATGEAPKAYALICVEDEPPHGARILVLDDLWLARGRHRYRKALNTYAECRKADHWPAYDASPTIISAPQWVRKEMEEATDE